MNQLPHDTGILLTNTGTPDSPNWAGVAKYLSQFLTDRRIIRLSRLVWYPVLFGLILPLRSASSARIYRHIWQKEGSPLLIHMQNLAAKLADHLGVPVAVGMNYGNPSIPAALATLRKTNIRRLIVIPLYPQYSTTSTASSFDRLTKALQKWEPLPELTFIQDYADSPAYIDAVCESVRMTWQHSGKKFLLFSFHGIPRQYADAGDPYPERCLLTANQVAAQLGLSAGEYRISFQSRTGPTEWLVPYTEDTLQTLPQEGITDIQVICPGFSVDCLETLEEIDMRGRKTFMQHGGKSFEYIPALNEGDRQIGVLDFLIRRPNDEPV